MKKKTISFVLAFVLVLTMSVIAHADESSDLKVPSAYMGEGTSSTTLYTFVSAPSTDVDLADGYDAEATVTDQGDQEGQTYRGRTEKVTDSGTKVFYYLLVDNSASMKAYAEWIGQFVDELVSTNDGGTVYSLGHFDSDFTSDVTSVSGDELVASLDSIPYDGKETEPYTAIAQAIQAQAGLRKDGLTPDCLMNVIILTDGQVATFDGDLTDEEDEARQAIAESKDVVVHSVCVASWDSGSALHDVLSSGTGCSLPSQTGATHTMEATAAADQIFDFVGGLYRSEFVITGDAQEGASVRVRFSSDEAGSSYETETVDDVPIAMSGREGSGSDTGSSEAASSDGTESETQEGDEAATGGGRRIPWGVLAIIVGVVAVLVVVVVVRSRRRGSSAKAHRKEIAYGPVARIEVLNGPAFGLERDVSLVDGVTFGTDRTCDLPLGDPHMAARHGRLYVSDGQAYVEPLEEDEPIYLNGMRLFGANPLRSGDVLEAGQTQLRITISYPDMHIQQEQKTIVRR